MNNIKMLYFGRIDVSEGIDVNKTSESKECVKFFTTGIFWIKGLSFKHMNAIDAIIY